VEPRQEELLITMGTVRLKYSGESTPKTQYILNTPYTVYSIRYNYCAMDQAQ